jgi:hypothetical protein
MVISHAHRFIYLKTWKTASTSVQAALATVCGKHRIIIDEANVDIVLGSDRPHPMAYGPAARLAFRADGGHSLPATVRSFVGEEAWNTYYKFSFVRNPWDTYVSGYWWRKSGSVPEHFEDIKQHFKQWLLDGNGRRNYAIISIDGVVVADFIGRYENLGADFKKAFEPLHMEPPALPSKVEPKSKGSFRLRDEPYQEYYDDESRAYVAEADRPLIERFGYQF